MTENKEIPDFKNYRIKRKLKKFPLKDHIKRKIQNAKDRLYFKYTWLKHDVKHYVIYFGSFKWFPFVTKKYHVREIYNLIGKQNYYEELYYKSFRKNVEWERKYNQLVEKLSKQTTQ